MSPFEIGDIVRFAGYRYTPSDVPRLFTAGDALVVIESEKDGVFRCARADYDGREIMEFTDTVFREEIQRELPATSSAE